MSKECMGNKYVPPLENLVIPTVCLSTSLSISEELPFEK